MENLSLDINMLNKMPIEDIISLYKQGYKIYEPEKLEIKSLASTCTKPTIVQNTPTTITITPSGGTGPYTKVEILRDGIVVDTKLGSWPLNTPIIITYNFPTIGTGNRFTTRVTDSCSSVNTYTDTVGCVISVTAATTTTPAVITSFTVVPSTKAAPYSAADGYAEMYISGSGTSGTLSITKNGGVVGSPKITTSTVWPLYEEMKFGIGTFSIAVSDSTHTLPAKSVTLPGGTISCPTLTTSLTI